MKAASAAVLLAALTQLIAGYRWTSDPDFTSNVTTPSVSTAGTAATGGSTTTAGTAPTGGSAASAGTTSSSGGTTAAGAGGPGVTVSWQAPQLNEDGTPLLDLAGFRIRHGMTYGSYTSQINVDNPGATSYRVEGLKPGLYYFTVAAIDQDGQEGAPSRPHRIQVL